MIYIDSLFSFINGIIPALVLVISFYLVIRQKQETLSFFKALFTIFIGGFMMYLFDLFDVDLELAFIIWPTVISILLVYSIKPKENTTVISNPLSNNY